MTTFRENDSVIYTDEQGNQVNTFVIFDSDRKTGFTHINHLNKIVPPTALQLHAKSETHCTMPMDDSISFELFRQLKEKFLNLDKQTKIQTLSLVRDLKTTGPLAKAS